MYSQVYWTRNNPIDLPPELVNSIGRKLFNLFPGKILCKKRQDLTWKILERKYFQKTNIFRDETFSGKNFFRWKDFKERWWPSLAMKLIRWFSIVDHLHQQIKQDNISFLPHNATYLRWPTPVTRKSKRTPKTQTRRVLVGLPAILIAAKTTNRWTKFHNMFFFKTDRRNYGFAYFSYMPIKVKYILIAK